MIEDIITIIKYITIFSLLSYLFSTRPRLREMASKTKLIIYIIIFTFVTAISISYRLKLSPTISGTFEDLVLSLYDDYPFNEAWVTDYRKYETYRKENKNITRDEITAMGIHYSNKYWYKDEEFERVMSQLRAVQLKSAASNDEYTWFRSDIRIHVLGSELVTISRQKGSIYYELTKGRKREPEISVPHDFGVYIFTKDNFMAVNTINGWSYFNFTEFDFDEIILPGTIPLY